MLRFFLSAVFFIFQFSLFTQFTVVYAEGTYSSIGTADAADGDQDALNFSQGRVWTIDQYGKYIWLTQEWTSSNHHWAWSNNQGSSWTQGSEGYIFLTRASVAYDSINDKLHVIWVADNNTDGVIYRRYGITRDGSNNITAIAREDSGNINLQLDTSSSRDLEQPVALWVNDGSADGILIAMWSKNGSSLSEVRASMRRLSISAADGVAGNWESLDGTGDTFGTDPPAVEADKIFTASSGENNISAIIRGGTGARKDDLYVFVAQQTNSSGDIIRAYRAVWNSGSSDWSGGWQSPVTVGAFDTSSGYSLKSQLITKPVLDATNDRLYVGWSRWKTGGSGDTISIAYLSSTDTASSTVDIYSANGTHSYAPTLDIAYDSVQDFVYTSYVLSTTNGDNGSIQYKTYNGTSLSSATTFYTTPGGSAGEDGSADIPILFENRSSNRLLFAFRINGQLPPTVADPHSIYWGYITLPTRPTVAFTTSSASGSEATASVNIGVSVSATFTRDVSVDYSVTGGSATGSGTDYTLTSGTITISAGSSSQNIVLTINNDSVDESTETIIITLSDPEFATLGSNTTFTYSILDNDDAVVVSSPSRPKFAKDTRCHFPKPDFPAWAKVILTSKDGVTGVFLTWSITNATKLDILIDDGSGQFPWKYSKTINDGHEFLPNVSLNQTLKLVPFNNCAKGEEYIL